MPSRRRVLSTVAVGATGLLGGCAATREESKPVEVLLQNDDTEAWRLTVAVEDDAGEEVFRTEETIPADTGEDLGEVPIQDAFSGAPDERFVVRAWLRGESVGTFDYEITCPDENRFSLLVTHQPYTPDDGDPADYVADWCAE